MQQIGTYISSRIIYTHNGTVFDYFGYFKVFIIFRISNFFGLNITEDTLVVEMRIWFIKIGAVIVLHV
jgi:hypothetical protein